MPASMQARKLWKASAATLFAYGEDPRALPLILDALEASFMGNMASGGETSPDTLRFLGGQVALAQRLAGKLEGNERLSYMGNVHYALGNWHLLQASVASAQLAYWRSIQLLEQAHGEASPLLEKPMTHLGMVMEAIERRGLGK